MSSRQLDHHPHTHPGYRADVIGRVGAGGPLSRCWRERLGKNYRTPPDRSNIDGATMWGAQPIPTHPPRRHSSPTAPESSPRPGRAWRHVGVEPSLRGRGRWRATRLALTGPETLHWPLSQPAFLETNDKVNAYGRVASQRPGCK